MTEEFLVPPNTHIFLLGLAVGTSLLVFGVLLGYWLGRHAGSAGSIDRQKFLSFLQNLSSWTSQYAGDVSRYQSQLDAIDQKFRSNSAPQREELVAILSEIMQANRQLQARLESAEHKLEVQTDQISSYLTEARTDGLTGLFNRRAFDKAIDALYGDWSKKGQAFSLGLIDIDHFKQINDTYGHPAGDAVLKHVAHVLQAELGDAVCVARYGGEEFAVLSLEPVEQLAKTLDQLRAVVARLEVAHEERVISMTLSAGTAGIAADDKVGNLVRRADEALYAAKLGGRNRVYLHDDAVCRLITPVDATAAKLATTADAAAASSPAFSPTHQHLADRLRRIVEEESQRLAQH